MPFITNIIHCFSQVLLRWTETLLDAHFSLFSRCNLRLDEGSPPQRVFLLSSSCLLSVCTVQGSVLCSAGGCVVALVYCVDFCCSAAGSIVQLLPLLLPVSSFCSLPLFVPLHIEEVHLSCVHVVLLRWNSFSSWAFVSYVTYVTLLDFCDLFTTFLYDSAVWIRLHVPF